MANLRFSMYLDDMVRIQPIGDISTSQWESVLDWWSMGQRYDPQAKFIDVPITAFTQRKIWLRENWKNLGNDLVIDESVKLSLKSVEEFISQFVNLAEKNYVDVDSIDFELIKLTVKLTPFQRLNVASLISMPNGANFSVPGAGKTLTTLAVWEYFRVSGDISRLLVICPRSAFEAWEADSKMLIDLPVIRQFIDDHIDSAVEILYANYEQLENKSRLNKIIRWVGHVSTMVVFDEAHRVKGGGASIRWRACREIAAHSKRVDLLTGTPMPQSQEDLRNLLTLSWNGIPREFFSDSRLAGLNRGGIFVRTTKEELELPPMNIKQVELPMSPVQSDIYSALKRSFVGQFQLSSSDSNFFSRRGKAVMTMIAAATNPGLLMGVQREDAYLGLSWPPRELTGSERLMTVLESYVSHEIPEKYQWVSRYVAKAAGEGRKVLIWSTFIANLLALKRLLERYDPALIYGATNQEEREYELMKFRNSKDCSVLLSNPQTLGEGVSLHKECHEAIYIDRNYNAGLYLQSLDRIHRLGLPPDQQTTVIILQSLGSVDLRIARRLEDKIHHLGFYLNDTGLARVSLPSGDEDDLPDTMAGLDQVDLDDIYQHLRQDG
jgi:SNF2 family DNA or RNA helicase